MEKPISGFETYTISEDGTVKNTITGKRKIPTSNKAGKGYEYVDLYSKGFHGRKYIHRLVAEAFIPNPNRKPYVNHIDGNSHNNVISNLEWCTPLENVEHASQTIKTMKQYKLANLKRERAVKQLDFKSGRLIEIYKSIGDASRATEIPSSGIVAVLHGRQTRTKQYRWCYVEEYDEKR